MYWGHRRSDCGTGLLSICTVQRRMEPRLRLRREELTGALAPLLDLHFFRRVYIDAGAVAWPGQIDLAPDAMYAQIAREHKEKERVS